MRRRPFGWLATVVVFIVAAIVLIANASSGQVQGGTGRAKQVAGLFVTYPD